MEAGGWADGREEEDRGAVSLRRRGAQKGQWLDSGFTTELYKSENLPQPGL